MTRHDEIAAGLARVRDRIAGACADADPDAGEVRLVVVTKFFPATDVSDRVAGTTAATWSRSCAGTS